MQRKAMKAFIMKVFIVLPPRVVLNGSTVNSRLRLGTLKKLINTFLKLNGLYAGFEESINTVATTTWNLLALNVAFSFMLAVQSRPIILAVKW
jgi:hypothetical protein